MASIKQKILAFTAVMLIFGVAVFCFAVFHNEDGSDTVAFLLTDQDGRKTTHEDLSKKPLLVFFGFTSCDDICPVSLYQISKVVKELELTGQKNDISPVMITVDPERDTAEKMKSYLANFGDTFVGLTGSRVALENAADEFNAFMGKPPERAMKMHSGHGQNGEHTMAAIAEDTGAKKIQRINQHAEHMGNEHADSEFIENYQLSHSSVVYLVDVYSRVVEYISLDEAPETIAIKIRKHLATQGQNHG